MTRNLIGSPHSEPCPSDTSNDLSHSTAAPISDQPVPEQTASAAFSRVDLLTVIGVVVLLILLLTPAMARTRVMDQAFQCRNNLRQLIHGWRMYTEDNSGKLADSFDWVSGGENYSVGNPVNTNTIYLVNGLLGPYLKSPAVYKCPADMSTAVEGGVRLPRVRTLSMSQSFSGSSYGHLEDGDSPPNYWRHYQKETDMVLPAPANLWVFADENPDSVNDGSLAVAMTQNKPSLDKWQDGPTTLHDGSCGFAFADGHVEIHKWLDPRTLAMNVTYSSTFAHGWVQPNNNDIQWVKDRTTAPK
jgi:prepilin-type processing-associated H-X9-DG protein